MTFDEAYDILNNADDVGPVADQMEQWHPRILAMMLKAVNEAKRRRYPSMHPDFEAAIRTLQNGTLGGRID